MGLGLSIDLPSRKRGRSVAQICAGALLAAATVLLPASVQAQSFTWNGATPAYATGTNWNPPAGGPPYLPGQAAIFGATGSSSVVVDLSAMPTPFFLQPDSWTFSANAKSFTISGASPTDTVAFSVAGPTGGIINSANNGQTITIGTRISDGIAIPGPGTVAVMVQQLGNSTLVLTGTNGYSGGTLITSGIVQVTNANSLGTGTVTLNGGTLQMQHPAVVSVAFANNFAVSAPGGTVDANGAQVNLGGVVSDGTGGGVLRLTDSIGGGSVQLSGINTYSGGTLVSGTTLIVSNNSSVGTGTVTLDNGQFQSGAASLTFTNNFKINSSPIGSAIDANGQTLTITGNISDGNGPGKLTVMDSGGGGKLVLLGSNTYTGGTSICVCGTLQLGDATRSASLVGNVSNDGRFEIVNANTAGITTLTNDGGLTKFHNAASAATMTITNENVGDTVFLDNSRAGHATIINRFGGATIFDNFSSADSADITNRASGATVFSNNSTAGNAVITTLSGGSVLFFNNATGGNAQFITNGSGYVDFSGSSGPNGDGRITAGSIAGSGSYIIGAGNTLVVGGNNLSTVVSGVIADSCGCGPGSGSLEKVGSGTLTLSGHNTYTGTTTVNGGFLDVEGTVAPSSLLTVNAGGALTGAGQVGDTTIAGGGIFLPGNGFGTSTQVQGNLSFQPGALYFVQLNATSSTFANVTGAANVNGNVGVGIDANGFVMKQYMILQAASGVSGAFTGVSAPGGLVGNVSYDPNHAYLDLDLNYGAKNNLNVNQQNVANTLSNFFNANGGIASVFALLTPSGLTQASGEIATGTQQATFNAMSMFLNLLTDPFVSGRSDGAAANGGAQPYAEEGSLAYAARHSGGAREALAKIPAKADVARNDLLDNRWSVWGSAFGGGANISGNTTVGSSTADTRAFGLAAGADFRITPATIAGFALAGGGTNFSVNGLGSGRSDLFQAGAFVRHTAGNAYVTGAVAYGAQEVSTDRMVAVTGDHLQARFNTNAFAGRLEGGYRYVTPWVGITPYAAAQFTTLDLPAYAETLVAGPGLFGLNYNARTVAESRSELGLRTDRSFAMQNGILTLRGRFAWAHDFNTDRTAGAAFQALPGTFFLVNGAAPARDSALTTASAEMKWLNGWSAAVSFDGEFSDVYNSYAGKGVLRYAW